MRADPTPAENYLLDLGTILKDDALAAKGRVLAAKASGDHAFELGRLTAYYEVLSTMKSQALAFGLPLEMVSLQDLDPDTDLLAPEG